MPFRSRFSRPRKFSRRPRRVIRRRAKVSKKIKSYVKRAIHRNIENKDHIAYAANQTVQSWGTSTQGFSIPLINTLAQGTTDGTRIGNQVKVVRGQLKATMNLKPYDATSNAGAMPVWIKLFVVRSLSHMALESSLPNYDIFFKGNATYLDWQGNCLDLDLPVNPDEFRVLMTKQFKLGIGAINSGFRYDGWADNSPMCKKFTINWGKYVRKQLKFNDSANTPTNDNLYLVVQAVYADGSSTTGKQVCEIHYVNHSVYEDA